MSNKHGVSIIIAESLEEKDKMAASVGVEVTFPFDEILLHVREKDPVFHLVTSDLNQAHSLVRLLNARRAIISIHSANKPYILNWELERIKKSLTSPQITWDDPEPYNAFEDIGYSRK